MEDLLFNERAADIEVRRILASHGKAPRMKVAKVDGKIVQVVDSVDVDREHLVRMVEQADQRLAEAKADLAEFDRLTAQTQPAANPAPATTTPQTTAQPAPQAAAPAAPPAAPAPQQPPQPPVNPPAPTPAAAPVAPPAPAAMPTIQ